MLLRKIFFCLITSQFFLLNQGCKNKSSSPAPAPTPAPSGSNASASECLTPKAALALLDESAGAKKSVDLANLKIGAKSSVVTMGSSLRILRLEAVLSENLEPEQEPDYYLFSVCDEKGRCIEKERSPVTIVEMCLDGSFGTSLTSKIWGCAETRNRADNSKDLTCSKTPTTDRMLAKTNASDPVSSEALALCQNIVKKRAEAFNIAYKALKPAADAYLQSSSSGTEDAGQSQAMLQAIAKAMSLNTQNYAKLFTDAQMIQSLLDLMQSRSSASSGLQLTETTCLNQTPQTSGVAQGTTPATTNPSGNSNTLTGVSAAEEELKKQLADQQKAFEDKKKELEAKIAATDQEKQAIQKNMDDLKASSTATDQKNQESIAKLQKDIASVSAAKDQLNDQLKRAQVTPSADSRIIFTKDAGSDLKAYLTSEYIIPYKMKENKASIQEQIDALNKMVPEKKLCFTRDGVSIKLNQCVFGTDDDSQAPISKSSQVMELSLAGDGFGHFRLRSDGRCLGLKSVSGAVRAEFEDCLPTDSSQNITIEITDQSPENSLTGVKTGIFRMVLPKDPAVSGSLDQTFCLAQGSEAVEAKPCTEGSQEFYISNAMTSRFSEDQGYLLTKGLAWMFGKHGDDWERTLTLSLMIGGGVATALGGFYYFYRSVVDYRELGGTNPKYTYDRSGKITSLNANIETKWSAFEGSLKGRQFLSAIGLVTGILGASALLSGGILFGARDKKDSQKSSSDSAATTNKSNQKLALTGDAPDGRFQTDLVQAFNNLRDLHISIEESKIQLAEEKCRLNPSSCNQ